MSEMKALLCFLFFLWFILYFKKALHRVEKCEKIHWKSYFHFFLILTVSGDFHPPFLAIYNVKISVKYVRVYVSMSVSFEVQPWRADLLCCGQIIASLKSDKDSLETALYEASS